MFESESERERERERKIGRTRNRLKIVFDGRQISCTSIWILASLFLSSFSVAGYRVRFKRVGGHRGACMRVRKHDRVVVTLQGDNHWSLNESVQRMDSISWICEREKEWVRERERERERVGGGGWEGLGTRKSRVGWVSDTWGLWDGDYTGRVLQKKAEKKLSIYNYYVINECMLSHCDKTFCFCM